jgi:hypothetical protein
MDAMALMGFSPQRFVTIRREKLLSDGFAQLNRLGDGLKGRVRIQFVNEHGIEEAGVDGGGLFKDFLENLVKEVKDHWKSDANLHPACNISHHKINRCSWTEDAPGTRRHSRGAVELVKAVEG